MSTQREIEQLQTIITALALREPDSEQIAHLEQERDDWKQRAEKADVTREEAIRLMLQMTSRAQRAENRAGAWWEAAKRAVRERNECYPVRAEDREQLGRWKA